MARHPLASLGQNYYIGEAETPAYKMLGVGGAVLRLDKAILLERDAEVRSLPSRLAV